MNQGTDTLETAENRSDDLVSFADTVSHTASLHSQPVSRSVSQPLGHPISQPFISFVRVAWVLLAACLLLELSWAVESGSESVSESVTVSKLASQ